MVESGVVNVENSKGTKYNNVGRLGRMETKLDKVIDNQAEMKLTLTRRVDRNTLIISGFLWFAGILIIAIVGAAFALL